MDEPTTIPDESTKIPGDINISPPPPAEPVTPPAAPPEPTVPPAPPTTPTSPTPPIAPPEPPPPLSPFPAEPPKSDTYIIKSDSGKKFSSPNIPGGLKKVLPVGALIIFILAAVAGGIVIRERQGPKKATEGVTCTIGGTTMTITNNSTETVKTDCVEYVCDTSEWTQQQCQSNGCQESNGGTRSVIQGTINLAPGTSSSCSVGGTGTCEIKQADYLVNGSYQCHVFSRNCPASCGGTIPTPTKVPCDKTCTSSDQCQAGHECYSVSATEKKCRKTGCLKAANCNCTLGCGDRCDTGTDIGYGTCDYNKGLYCHNLSGTESRCGKVCSDGAWDTTAPCCPTGQCGTSSNPCSTGCCLLPGTCESGTESTACGTGGYPCDNCTLSGKVCVNKACVVPTSTPATTTPPTLKGHCESCNVNLPIVQCALTSNTCKACSAGGAKCVSNNCEECTSTTCGCTVVKLFNASNQEILPSAVTAGQQVKIGVGGTGINQYRGRVKVAGTDGVNLLPASACKGSALVADWCETDQYLPSLGYYVNYTIPTEPGTYSVEGGINCAGIWK